MSENTRPLHVGLFVPSFRGGGAERVMVTLANALAGRGHRVDLLVAEASGPYASEVEADVNLIDLDCGRVVKALWPLRCYFRASRPDAVMSTMTHTNAITSFAMRLSGHGARLILREANEPTPNAGRYERIIHRLGRWPYLRADAVLSVSPAVRDSVRADMHLPASMPMPVIDNPAVTPKLLELMQAPPAPAWPGDSPVFLAVGRLTRAKGFTHLLDAFARVRAQRPARLLILGEGEQREALERQLAQLGCGNDVHMPGFNDNPFAWMAACDVFVLSSIFEGSPNSLIQAVACGAEVVSTLIPGSTDVLLENGVHGRLVPMADSDALAEAMLAALDEPRAPDVEVWRQRFDSEAIIDQYEALLRGDRPEPRTVGP